MAAPVVEGAAEASVLSNPVVRERQGDVGRTKGSSLDQEGSKTEGKSGALRLTRESEADLPVSGFIRSSSRRPTPGPRINLRDRPFTIQMASRVVSW